MESRSRSGRPVPGIRQTSFPVLVSEILSPFFQTRNFSLYSEREPLGSDQNLKEMHSMLKKALLITAAALALVSVVSAGDVPIPPCIFDGSCRVVAP
jgi:hypothetical protein